MIMKTMKTTMVLEPDDGDDELEFKTDKNYKIKLQETKLMYKENLGLAV